MIDNQRKPAIRYAEFNDVWEQRKFGNIIDYLQNNTLSRANLSEGSGLAKNIHYGDVLIKFGELLDVRRSDIPTINDEEVVSKYKASYLQNGDLVFADTAEDATVGKCSEISGLKDEILLSGLHTIPCRPLCHFATGFLGYYLNSDAYHNQLIPLMQGTKVTSISKSVMQKTIISCPSSEHEQKKIGVYFKELDNLITIHQREYDKVLEIKKAMLEKMFPKNGEDRPEIRFKGFTEAWERRKFLDVTCRVTTMSDLVSLPRVEYEDINSGQGTLNKNLYEKSNTKKGVLFQENDVLFGKLRPYLKNWLLTDFSGIAVGDFWVIRGEDTDSSFIYSLIQSSAFYEVTNQSTGTKMPRADWNLVSNTVFGVPRSRQEQQQIGIFLLSLDNLITLHQRELKKLQNMKKALLGKMFVQG